MDHLPPFEVDRAIGALRKRGLRSTALKRAVLGAFETGDCALTVEDIASRIGAGADLSPLYRCLASLEEAGVLTHFYLGDGGRRYDLADEFGGHHHHLVCENCARITRIDGCALARDTTAEATTRGHVVRDHELVLKGVCAECRAVGQERREVGGERRDLRGERHEA
ncbi:MAG: Fur family transcriptional regulator [Thermoleophilia bacterium]